MQTSECHQQLRDEIAAVELVEIAAVELESDEGGWCYHHCRTIIG